MNSGVPFVNFYGVSLNNMGNGYDFLSVEYGRQSYDSETRKCWHKHLPWMQWNLVRHSFFEPDGTCFVHLGRKNFRGCSEIREQCPKSLFSFFDYDGQAIKATCTIEEWEWERGDGWFKWVRHFNRPKVRRSLSMDFSDEVGPEKGGWKGGILGTSIEMLPGETPEAAFQRYCVTKHESKGGDFRLEYNAAYQPK